MAEPTTLEPIETTSLAVTTTAANSAVVGSYNEKAPKIRQVVRVRCTVDVCLRFSQVANEDPTAATTDDIEISANVHEYFDMLAGTKISAIRASSATGNGVLKITRCARPF